MDNKLNYTIYEACKKVEHEIKGDFGGGSPTPKTFLMSYIAQNQKIKNFVEIGIYRGRSLFSTAYSVYKNGGKSYGVDPYLTECAKENDVQTTLKDKIDSFLEETDFEAIYRDVLTYKEECGYGESIQIIRKTSADAVEYFKDNDIKPDMLHIDGNHDTKFVKSDFELYYEIMENGSFIVFDDINWDSVRLVYEQAKKKCYCVFECEYFGVLLKEDNSIASKIKVEKLSKKLSAIFERAENVKEYTETPIVTVGILTYNHENYVEECLSSVIEQQGNFKLNIIICDDNSTDKTSKIIEDVISRTSQHENLKIDFHKNDENIGMVANFNKLINLIKETNCDYFSFCEGDDYYLSSNRLAKHLDFCKRNPQFAFSYNKIMFYWQNENKFEIYDSGFDGEILPTEELVRLNHLGNLNVSFICGDILKNIKDDLFENKFTGDWMLHIYCSQYGDIGFLNAPYNVYRKHENGIWTGKPSKKQCEYLLGEIQKYNEYLNFTYDAEFAENSDSLYSNLKEYDQSFPKDISVAIIDDIFPHPLSGFRYQEFTSILKGIPNSVIYSSGTSLCCLDNTTMDELMINYKRKHPELSSRVFRYTNDLVLDAKLLYCTFLGNAYLHIIDLAEKHRIPFVFTLYPGGAFTIGTKEGDEKLRKVFNSPWFYKVIVTQDITHSYLIDNGFCTEEQIEDIFGVVMPLEKLELSAENKKHYGINKDTLDICFVAHKYTEYGQDKGYDVFIETAKKLSRKYDFINFHVIGPWDESVLDISAIKNIRFYGSHDQEWFDTFYQDKDIILSPNINGQIVPGSFDGFPTGCLTDAALRDVAMFATDPLSLNNERFVNKRDIVIIEHDVEDIVGKIEYYINNPAELKDICKNGHERVKKLYCYNAQIKPRLQILFDALQAKLDLDICEETSKVAYKEPLIKIAYREITPLIFQRLYRFIKSVPGFLYREFVPNVVQRAYRKLKRIIKNAK